MNFLLEMKKKILCYQVNKVVMYKVLLIINLKQQDYLNQIVLKFHVNN